VRKSEAKAGSIRNVLYGERPPMKRFKETNGEPTCAKRLRVVKTGSPTGGNTYGDGTPIVGSIARYKRRGSSRKRTRATPLIKGSRVGIGKFYTERYA